MKELLFSVTAKDCDWDYFKGTGAGGQKRNKTSSAVRCTHRASGAVGRSEESRHQSENRQIAFKRMAETDEFKRWHRAEVRRRLGEEVQIEEEVDRLMHPSNLLIELQEEGKWVREGSSTRHGDKS